MVFYRILLPILFCVVPILLLNSVGKNISVLDMRQMWINIFDSNMKQVYSITYWQGDDIIALSCDAINKYNGTFINIKSGVVFYDPCLNNGWTYNFAISSMITIIIIQLLIFCLVLFLLYVYQRSFETHNKYIKIILFSVLVLFMMSIFCDINALSSDNGIAMFYGNKIYAVAGEIYVYPNIYERYEKIYDAKFQGGVQLIRSVCDMTNFIPRAEYLYFKQIIKTSQCDHIIYILAPGAIMRGGIIILGLIVIIVHNFDR